MNKQRFQVDGKVEIFPQKGGWHYVRVPKEYSELTKDFVDRGLVAICATLGKTSWKTSLLPFGDGTHFIAISAKLRKAENLKLGDTIHILFQLIDRTSC